MMPRSLPLSEENLALYRPGSPAARMQVASAGWRRKSFAIAMHLACLGLFGLTVVWPVASPLASGELAREFKPVLDALAAFVR